MKFIFVLFALLLVFPALVICQDEDPNADVAGAKDHALFNRLSSTRIPEYEDHDFEAFDFPISVDDGGAEKSIRVEGHKTMIIYAAKDGSKPNGWLAIHRNFENAVKKIGGKIVFAHPEDLYVVLKIVKGNAETWVQVANNAGYGDGSFRLTVVEKAAMEQQITASGILDSLNNSGHVALYINFETGKATVQEDSKPIIAAILDLLKNNPDLSLKVEGHTDSVGKAVDNKKLSDGRAKAVVGVLVNGGIAQSRLSATGYGAEKPIADNATEEGRAKNRRVELVKMGK